MKPEELIAARFSAVVSPFLALFFFVFPFFSPPMLFYLYFWPKEIYGSELNSSIINVFTIDSLIYKKIFFYCVQGLKGQVK